MPTKRREGAMFGEFSPQEGSMSMTYLTTDELSAKIKYDVRTRVQPVLEATNQRVR
jgi:hypothetical protein